MERYNDNQLLCTFFDIKDKKRVVDEILQNYELLKENIYLVRTDDKRYFFTYNVRKSEALARKMKRTILIHRKQDTNTIFTINSLNELQRQINNGVLDKEDTDIINWDNYRDKMLLFTGDTLTINSISLVDVITIIYRDKENK
jgi:hypothetical protein